ncbi:MAG: acyl-ACP desaturase [Bacteroidota bacterium]
MYNFKLSPYQIEVMKTIEKSVGELIDKYLKPVKDSWQPSDFLPETRDENFSEVLSEIQELSHELDYDLFATLIGDTITEEALPSYESWLMNMQNVNKGGNCNFTKWIRAWTAEENRHGDLLGRYLYLSGRVNMHELEISTQHLLQDGFDIGTDQDPYRNFIYTSFQELATNISHRRVAVMAKKSGNTRLAKICGVVAADEARHARAYMDFVDRILTLDPSGLLVAFEDMMRKKIVMPAHLLRESGGQAGELFQHFSDAAQRIGVYTASDYIDILKSLLKTWNVDMLSDLSDEAERARDYLMSLPQRLERISSRIRIPEKQYEFKWIYA